VADDRRLPHRVDGEGDAVGDAPAFDADGGVLDGGAARAAMTRRHDDLRHRFFVHQVDYIRQHVPERVDVRRQRGERGAHRNDALQRVALRAAGRADIGGAARRAHRIVDQRGDRLRWHARTLVGEALRLSPRDTLAYIWMTYAGTAKNLFGTYELAIAWFQRAIEANRNFPFTHFSLAAALAQLSRLDEARSAVKAGFVVNPTFTISRARANWSAASDDPTYLSQLGSALDGMRKAGVPEE
jgi:tetratricopeptide (TPR) repeat protein